ncbi:hypothetical protein L1987_13584 [Smallanthus sonchifolius]|uniref:Uncharacterized protein n=1 Tax=Smallanthus sonchifolius TaxID=185202 RepID=A0ACB9JJ68_9ASTR|nr:hypothetical protein L1987_13584 [Smallanthus sonchifolius]
MIEKVESVEEPGDPDESLEVVSIDTSNPEPLSFPIVHAEGIEAESSPKSRVPRKRTRALIESSNLGRYKLWWKDLMDEDNRDPWVGRSRSFLMLGRTWRPRRMKVVPVRIKEKPPDRLG